MLLRRYLIAALCVAAFAVAPTAHASLDNKGTEFVMAFLRGYGTPTLELHLTADVATNVTIEYPIGTVIAVAAVNPGAVTIVSIPSSAASWTFGSVDTRVIRATAAQEFVCYMVSRETATSDAALALPLETFNTEFIVASYTPLSPSSSEFGVVAGYDNTTVTITPSVTLSSGQAAGVPFSIVLNKGQGFVVAGSSSGSGGDVTGSIVTADAPVGMANGNTCVFIPPGVWACDHIFEVAQPTQTWGKRAIVENLPNRAGGSIYRILASQNGTTVMQDGAGIGTINRGGYIEVSPVTGSHVFESTNPIFVVQYMVGQDYPGSTLGDPAMGNMMPSEQYLKSYTFSTVGGGQFVQNYVTIIAPSSDVGTLTLDGVPIPNGDFTPIGVTGFSSTIKSLSSGTHATASTNPHGITVEGYNAYDSYLYPGGALFQFINPVGDANAPLCGDLTPDGYCVSATATDNRATEDVNGDGILDPEEDLNGNGLTDVDAGIFFVELDPTSTNLTLVTESFVPGAGEVDYQVCLTDNTTDGTGSVIVTDGAGNTCSNAITIVANRPPVMTCRTEPLTVEADDDCSASVIPEQLIVSVYDPDDSGDETSWTLSMSPSGPFTTGTHAITITATDDRGATATCEATLIVVDATAPELTLAASVALWSPDHTTVTFNVTDIVAEASDNCDALTPGDAVITMASSDEPENAIGNGDGNTVDDIVIADDCKSVTLRKEREGTGNGRVYRVHLALADAAGNTTAAEYVVEVRKNNNGTPAVENAVAYLVTSACAGSGKPSVRTRIDVGTIAIESVQPNPFDDATTVTYAIAAPGHATLVVKELTGRTVATLVDADLAAGSFSARFDAAGIPNGTYFIALTAGGVTVVQPVTLKR